MWITWCFITQTICKPTITCHDLKNITHERQNVFNAILLHLAYHTIIHKNGNDQDRVWCVVVVHTSINNGGNQIVLSEKWVELSIPNSRRLLKSIQLWYFLSNSYILYCLLIATLDHVMVINHKKNIFPCFNCY
jgi:hypothetical protein